MINASHTSPKKGGTLRLAFKVSDTSAGSFTIGRRGFLIDKNGVRVPYTVIICSLTGKGVLELERPANAKRA
jgi:hypothetical protein